MSKKNITILLAVLFLSGCHSYKQKYDQVKLKANIEYCMNSLETGCMDTAYNDARIGDCRND